MTDARVKDFFDKMAKAGVVKGSDDYKKIYTTEFVCKKLGMDLKK
jgi:NitT/TauT family transport system substrate-binding protein